MKFGKIKLVYFSPTGTTKAVVRGIADGINTDTIECADLTPSSAASSEQEQIPSAVPVIFGVPVYGGRVPLTVLDRLQHIKGNGTPAVIVAVYGNRRYDDALLELKNVVEEQGFIPLAGGVFIGEHSYSSEKSPIAAGRPDEQDLLKAESFGARIREVLENFDPSDEPPELKVPGNFPYRDRGGLFQFTPVVDDELCTKCGQCAAVCPVDAISIDKRVCTDADSCIMCYACMRICPADARIMTNPRIPEAAAMMSVKCAERREPEMFMRWTD
ncbi:MAG: 4Fe-4S binding protein [Kiritimatiellia bacterium]